MEFRKAKTSRGQQPGKTCGEVALVSLSSCLILSLAFLLLQVYPSCGGPYSRLALPRDIFASPGTNEGAKET